MTERHTQDGYIVFDHDAVYEIMYEHINAEISQAYPRAAQCHQIPPHVKVWKLYYSCLQECKTINQALKSPTTTPHPIPAHSLD